MSIYIVRDAVKMAFAKTETPLQICAADGTILGYFTPAKPGKLNLECPISQDEMDRRVKAGGGRPLKDILRELENRS
jgi:hypothetical protein